MSQIPGVVFKPYVSGKCNSCKRCIKACPQSCIDISACRAKIKQEHYLHCGKCIEVCPLQAIGRRRL